MSVTLLNENSIMKKILCSLIKVEFKKIFFDCLELFSRDRCTEVQLMLQVVITVISLISIKFIFGKRGVRRLQNVLMG